MNASESRPKGDSSEGPSALRLGALVFAMVAAYALAPRLFGARESPLAGHDAPAVAFAYVANAPADGAASLSALKGKPVVLDFWATWCGPCQAEAPVVDQLAHRHAADGLAVIGVNTSDEAGNAGPWARAHHISYPIAFDDGQRAARAFGVENLPTLVVIGRDGKIAAVRTGMTTDAELESLVRKVL